jgi:hypothetical protein
VGVVFSDVK